MKRLDPLYPGRSGLPRCVEPAGSHARCAVRQFSHRRSATWRKDRDDFEPANLADPPHTLNPEGRNSSGTVLWETFSDAPRDEAEVRKLASSLVDHPRLVLWGRAWRYGKGTVVEAFLLVRGQNEDASFAKEVWTVALSPTSTLTVSVPRTEVEFAPVVIRGDLLAELEDPLGLKLYASQIGNQVKGTVGNRFRALQGFTTRRSSNCRMVLQAGFACQTYLWSTAKWWILLVASFGCSGTIGPVQPSCLRRS